MRLVPDRALCQNNLGNCPRAEVINLSPSSAAPLLCGKRVSLITCALGRLPRAVWAPRRGPVNLRAARNEWAYPLTWSRRDGSELGQRPLFDRAAVRQRCPHSVAEVVELVLEEVGALTLILAPNSYFERPPYGLADCLLCVLRFPWSPAAGGRYLPRVSVAGLGWGPEAL